jgi:hypothetical protein
LITTFKAIKLETNTPGVIAVMDLPHIARLFDASRRTWANDLAVVADVNARDGYTGSHAAPEPWLRERP